jgi:lactate permease
MPIAIIPKSPERLRLFWQAYFWILVSTVLAFPILRPTRAQLAVSLRKWLQRAPRPMAASAIFFAIAFVYSHSGKGGDWVLASSALNMVSVIAEASARTFGSFYPLIAPFLGLFAGFISGSEASSIAMLTELHLKASEQVGVNGILIAAASGIGGGLASVISPAKLQNASASIDRIGEEARVIPLVLVISLLITAVCAIMTLFMSF